MSTPRILSVTGTVHPQAEVQSVSAATGVATFRWLDAAGNPVDSGGSIARFTVTANPPVPGEPVTYAEPSDATLTTAIQGVVGA